MPVWAASAPAASATPVAGVPGLINDAGAPFDGIERCAAWEHPPDTVGYELVVCSDSLLHDYFAGTSDPDAPPHVSIHYPASHIPGGAPDGVPASISESSIEALAADTIVSDLATTADVQISALASDGGYPILDRVLLRGVSLTPTSTLHVDLSDPRSWKLEDAAGATVAAAVPRHRGGRPDPAPIPEAVRASRRGRDRVLVRWTMPKPRRADLWFLLLIRPGPLPRVLVVHRDGQHYRATVRTRSDPKTIRLVVVAGNGDGDLRTMSDPIPVRRRRQATKRDAPTERAAAG